MRVICLSFFSSTVSKACFAVLLLLPSLALATTYNSNGSSADVQAKINSASSGDTVTIPAGTFSWSTAVTITGKGIHLQGIGASIINGAVAKDGVLQVSESAGQSVEISGLTFMSTNTTSDPSTTYFIIVNSVTNGKPVLLHDCQFTNNGFNFNLYQCRWYSNRGVVWSCTFTSTNYLYNGITFDPVGDAASWSRASSEGLAGDPNGDQNVYVEDCHFQFGYNGVTDVTDNARVVVRHCTFYMATIATHGPDTGVTGARQGEFYDNFFTYYEPDDYKNGSSIANWFYLRGGTYVVTDNAMPDIPYGKSEIVLMVQNLRRNAGPYACWGANTSGVQYPAPHQIGQGSNGTSTVLDPLYIWNNTGTGGSTPIGLQEYAPNECGSGADLVADYIKSDRDYKLQAKPGYTKYTYPHPLRGGDGGGDTPPSAPEDLKIVP